MGRGEQYKPTLSDQGIAGRWARVCGKSINCRAAVSADHRQIIATSLQHLGQSIAPRKNWTRPVIKTDSRTGRSVLMVAHCAGMVDMVALPVWVGTLIAAYKFDRPWWSTPSRC